MLRRIIGEEIELVTKLAPNLPAIRFDPGQIEQVILNLAVNARDAMPDGGTLTIETARVELASTCVTLSISDNGTGMDEGTKLHVFEPFFTTKPPGQGTGLGLATIYGIVEQSGGHITFESELAKGTTFVVYLPTV
jgi:signal transduction histidine kinase